MSIANNAYKAVVYTGNMEDICGVFCMIEDQKSALSVTDKDFHGFKWLSMEVGTEDTLYTFYLSDGNRICLRLLAHDVWLLSSDMSDEYTLDIMREGNRVYRLFIKSLVSLDTVLDN